MANEPVDVSIENGTATMKSNGNAAPIVASIADDVCAVYVLAANGKPIANMQVVDKENGTSTPVNVATCAEAVACSKGITLEEHLQTLHSHAADTGAHLTVKEKAEIETQTGAQTKATAAKNEAVAAAAVLIATAKAEAATDATAKANAARDAAYKYADTKAAETTAHKQDTTNPHKVTAAQVGLGNVPNKATNDLQPTYTEAATLDPLTSGERLAVAFGKIAKAVTTLIAHIGNKANPHGVTASQTGALPKTGGTMTGTMTVNGIVLTEGKDYGDSLPETGVKGQLFFLKRQ